jgi:hypothetical protein
MRDQVSHAYKTTGRIFMNIHEYSLFINHDIIDANGLGSWRRPYVNLKQRNQVSATCLLASPYLSACM